MGETGQAPARGWLAEGEHRLALRIYYEDTDAGGVVYHANYLRFCERARTEMMALLGIGEVAALARDGLAYVVAAAQLRFHRPARLGDVIVVASKVVETRGARCRVQQRVMRDGEVLADVGIELALLGADGRPRPHPKAWLAALRIEEGPGTAQ